MQALSFASVALFFLFFPLLLSALLTPAWPRDKMGVTAKAKAPSDDAEYNAAVAFLESQQAELADLETKAGYANATAVKLAGEMERMVLQADKLSQSTGLGRTADLSGNKSFLDAHKARWTKVDADLKELKAELSAMKKHVQERHNAGAEMKKLVTKADGLEAKSDPKADVARAEADRTYCSQHVFFLTMDCCRRHGGVREAAQLVARRDQRVQVQRGLALHGPVRRDRWAVRRSVPVIDHAVRFVHKSSLFSGSFSFVRGRACACRTNELGNYLLFFLVWNSLRGRLLAEFLRWRTAANTASLFLMASALRVT